MLPQENAVLLSFINMKLRDGYQSLDDLCGDLEADRAEIEEKLSSFGYVYDGQSNRFVPRL